MQLVFRPVNRQGTARLLPVALALSLGMALAVAVPHAARAQQPAASAAPDARPAEAPADVQVAPSMAPSAVPDAAVSTSPVAPVPASTLPHDITFSSMFFDATPIVKGVILALVCASVLTWTVWLAKIIELGASRRSLQRALAALSSAKSLSDVTRTGDRTVDALLQEAVLELGQSKDLPEANVSGRIAARLERVQAAAGRRALIGTNVLATIGSSAPFVGLFGTVWGIMASFISISQAQTTNLMVVAPGIAEALLATAFGLIAAIPAGIIYNAFARIIAGHRGLFGDAATLVLCLAGRDLDRRALAAAS
jgi:biopolymer transport protein ExbB